MKSATTYNASKLLKQLPKEEVYDWNGSDFEKVPFSIAEYADITSSGLLTLDAEREHSQAVICDYWGEHRDGLPWINPKLIQWAEGRGLYWDWNNPAEIVLLD